MVPNPARKLELSAVLFLYFTAAAFARLANIRSAVTAEVLDIDAHRPYVDGGNLTGGIIEIYGVTE